MIAPAVPITALYAVPLALLVVALSARVSLLRRRHRVGLGDGGLPVLAQAIRAHGNAVENIPLALALMALLELNGGPSALLHTFGVWFVAARLIHAIGLTRSAGASLPRLFGAGSTLLILLGLALLNLVFAV
ncbi:MAG TPA: MAPEG family protein [Gammaproteobacteria bacterium]|nr:MAPEG family protein [Gammaproteobacteria bacterium]